MRSPVQLYLRVRLSDGSYPYLKAAFAPNGRLRPHHAVHAGRATEFPGATYYLRYAVNGKRKWEEAGTEPTLALTRLQKKVIELQTSTPTDSHPAPAEVKLEPATPAPPKDKTQTLLHDAIAEYLIETKQHKSKKTHAAYTITLFLFCRDAFGEGRRIEHSTNKTLFSLARNYPNKPLDQITRKDLLDFALYLKEKVKSSPRTVRNRIDYFQIFLHHFDLKSILEGKDLPTYTTKKARAYSKESLDQLFAAADLDEQDLLYFFLCTGAREQEAQYVCWTDIDLDLKIYTVTEHLDLGYQPKDKEEGGLPIPDVLVDALKARRKRYPTGRLIFPGKKGKPDGHKLRTIKRLALRTGLNCGQCINKAGKSCEKHAVCKQFVLHKLRKTFATTLHHNGLPAQTLQRYLRHSDLDTTLGYIADADNETIRSTINQTFTGFAGGAR